MNAMRNSKIRVVELNTLYTTTRSVQQDGGSFDECTDIPDHPALIEVHDVLYG